MSHQVSVHSDHYSTNIMRIFVCLLALSCSAFAAESPIPRGALLVLPQGSNSSSTTTTPAPHSDTKGNLEALNARLTEENGSERGVYHVYLPDGRLQRVQYTAAPANTQQTARQAQVSSSKEGIQSTNGFTYTPGAVYFIQVPSDRLQNLQSAAEPQTQNATRQANQTSPQVSAPNDSAARYSQAPGAPNTQYLPITVVSAEQLAQLRSSGFETSNNENQINENQGYTSNSFQASARQEQPTPGYVANTQGSASNISAGRFSQAAEAPNTQYRPVTVVSAEQLSQLRSSGAAISENENQQPAQNYENQGYFSNSNQASARQEQPTLGYVANPQYSASDNSAARYIQAADAPNTQYLPITVVSAEQFSQLRSSGAATSDNENQQLAQNYENQGYFSNSNQASARQEQPTPGYVASIEYTQVEPIPAPIYSYSSGPLVRILRYAH